ncbi:MAG TPA: hypothetical protein VK179_15225 [Bacteroidales bacterium]|nr:hypothetical protein [Bacteroidales bacterium]
MNKQSIIKNLSNISGWRTKRKLVIIESDDWGSIRMPSSVVFDKLVSGGIDLLSGDGFRFNKYDSLESSEDLNCLFDTLNNVRDISGRPAVFTPVSVVANPDFRKIKQADFREYFYEPFTETLKKYPGCENTFALWNQGISNRLFMPQFHGREHLNVKAWLRALQNKNNKILLAFENEMWGISTAQDPQIRLEIQAAFDHIDPTDVTYHKQVITTGLDLFEKTFGYRAKFFVPPNGPFSNDLIPTCYSAGIRYLSTPKIHSQPKDSGDSRKRLHWIGQKDRSGIIFITRNCFFEPSIPGIDCVDACLYDISVAFKWHKPAVISSHRVNYTGSLDKRNRDNGLNKLQILLKEIVKRWPEVEFLTSDELGDLLSDK